MTVFEDLLVKNAMDFELARRGKITDSEVRQATVRFKVDTGAHRNLITAEVCKQLGLYVADRDTFMLAGGATQQFDICSPVRIYWHNRSTPTDAIIAPNARNNLLSVTVLESLGLMVDPTHSCLAPAFEDGVVGEIE